MKMRSASKISMHIQDQTFIAYASMKRYIAKRQERNEHWACVIIIKISSLTSLIFRWITMMKYFSTSILI